MTIITDDNNFYDWNYAFLVYFCFVVQKHAPVEVPEEVLEEVVVEEESIDKALGAEMGELVFE